ncbi:hypothetical protein AB0F18_32195 [Streptomyces sp. NPDC029216]|uniref:hypothetical protein n=1 Tax=Streptomyces sp. NPDC029216 TaxID=3154701 RepID=UPI0033DB6CB2
MRRDQLRALAALRRRVAHSRKERAEIITDNTLIRVAVDLLLRHADKLSGDTEEQLLKSVTTATTMGLDATRLAVVTALASLRESDDIETVFALCKYMSQVLPQLKAEASNRAAAT